MNNKHLFQIRVTGVLIEDDSILLVKQELEYRECSLPGGKLENGETIEEGLLREVYEETGLNTKILKLLYLCEKPDTRPSLLHITFLLERIGGKIKLPTNEFEDNPIYDVKMVPINNITEYGFHDEFKRIIKNDFPMSGNYAGLKGQIGL